MKTGIVLTSIVLLAAGGLAVAAGNGGIDALNMGLSKTSVFDTPTPEPFSYSDTKAGKSKVLPRAYPGIPPQIPHKIDTYLPITVEDNQCLDCHDKPNLIGKKDTSKSPMSRAHYVDLRGSDDEMKGEIVGARFNCTQCHVPQSGAPALVENTFQGSEQDAGRIGELNLPEQARVIVITRGEESIIVGDDAELKVDDCVLVVAHRVALEKLKKQFSG